VDFDKVRLTEEKLVKVRGNIIATDASSQTHSTLITFEFFKCRDENCAECAYNEVKPSEGGICTKCKDGYLLDFFKVCHLKDFSTTEASIGQSAVSAAAVSSLASGNPSALFMIVNAYQLILSL
jgi:hypothetical protein